MFSTITFSISFAQTIDTSHKSENVTNSSTLLHSIPVTTTPIKYIVVIFQENNSFDQFFAT
jgi:phospholipase C